MLKSSTRNHINPSIQTEKRLELLMKKEMAEHQHVISSHHKEMQALRDSLKQAMEKFESIIQRNESDQLDFNKFISTQINLLNQRLISNKETIESQSFTIKDLCERLLEFQNNYASKKAAENIKNDLENQLRDSNTTQLTSFQEYQRDIKTLINSLKEEIVRLRAQSEQKHDLLLEKVESNFYLTRLDKEGISKEIRVYEKTIFIIEKKIENLYTLIERINKREESCLKPA